MQNETMKLSLLLSLVVTVSLMLTSCGGGSLQLSEGGIGGTGITTGRISVVDTFTVNGVSFDVSTASFTRDGANNSNGKDDFNVGEIVTVVGKVHDDGLSGIAENVSFLNNVEGPVTLLGTNTKLEVLGQEVSIDDNTVFHGFNAFSDLQENNVLEVSGFLDATGQIIASSLNLQSMSDEFEVKGAITNLDQTHQIFFINNLLIDYSNAEFENVMVNQLENGLFVEVEGHSFENSTFIADKIEIEISESIETGTEVEIEGIITRFVSSVDFDINGQRVTTNNQTEFKDGVLDALALNVKVEIKGKIDDQGVLIAKEVELEEESETEEELESEDDPNA